MKNCTLVKEIALEVQHLSMLHSLPFLFQEKSPWIVKFFWHFHQFKPKVICFLLKREEPKAFEECMSYFVVSSLTISMCMKKIKACLGEEKFSSNCNENVSFMGGSLSPKVWCMQLRWQGTLPHPFKLLNGPTTCMAIMKPPHRLIFLLPVFLLCLLAQWAIVIMFCQSRVNFLHFHLLQNQWADFNQTWWGSSSGGRDQKLFMGSKWPQGGPSGSVLLGEICVPNHKALITV